MNYPASTGQVAQALGVLEPQINELIRKGRIHPVPTVVAGRRQWQRAHVLQAAEQFGVLTAQLRHELETEVDGVPA